MDEQIHGLSLRDCAEIMSKDSALKAQYGERDYLPYLDQYLAERGKDRNIWAHAWNGWWARMEADPTGRLHAKFGTLQQEMVQKAHFADVADASQDAKEGVTLDLYAQLMARIAGGEDAEALVASTGMGMDQWQRAQAAWNAAMAADTDHHLTMQYGQLYAKYTPGFAQQMEDQTAAIMAQHHAEQAAGVPDEPEVEYTFDDMVRELGDAVPNTRWSAAHHVANAWDCGDKGDAALHNAALRAYELMVECLEQHDQHTVSNAESCAGDINMFAAEGFLTPEQADDVIGDIQRCLARAQDHLRNLEAAFAPIRDKAVPERVRMQSAIQDYTSLVETLEEIIEEWADNYSAPQSPAAQAASGFAAASTPNVPAASGGSFMDTLKGLPVIGNILKMLGL